MIKKKKGQKGRKEKSSAKRKKPKSFSLSLKELAERYARMGVFWFEDLAICFARVVMLFGLILGLKST